VRTAVQVLRREWFQGNLLVFNDFGSFLVLMRLSPALDARDWIQHGAADDDADAHHVE